MLEEGRGVGGGGRRAAGPCTCRSGDDKQKNVCIGSTRGAWDREQERGGRRQGEGTIGTTGGVPDTPCAQTPCVS